MLHKSLSFLIVLFLSGQIGCGIHHGGQRHVVVRTPPHAPAHGHRHRHHEHQLTFDSGIGVYKVTGLRDTYFHDGYYLKFIDELWHVSVHSKGPWKKATHGQIHQRLRKEKAKKHKKKHKHKKKKHKHKHKHKHHKKHKKDKNHDEDHSSTRPFF